MERVIEYILNLFIILAVFIYYYKISNNTYLLMNGYLISSTITFLTGTLLLYFFTNKVFKDLVKKSNKETDSS